MARVRGRRGKGPRRSAITREILHKCLCERIAALRGAGAPARSESSHIPHMLRLLCSVRLALHLARQFVQHFPNCSRPSPS